MDHRAEGVTVELPRFSVVTRAGAVRTAFFLQDFKDLDQFHGQVFRQHSRSLFGFSAF